MPKYRVPGFLTYFFIFLTMGNPLDTHAGYPSEKDSKGIHLAGHAGGSMLITEVYRDLSGAVTEFTNLPGPHLRMEISKYFLKNTEAGIDMSLSWLRGNTNTPDFSAIGWHHTMREPIQEPVMYNNRLYGPGWFLRYHILNRENASGQTSIFLKAGSGLLVYESELYKNSGTDKEFIFGKGYGKNKTTKVANAVYRMGGGLSRNLSLRIKLMISLYFNMVNYDFLDVVHNYDPMGNRRHTVGVFSDFSVGISYNLEKSMVPFMRKVKNRNLPDNLPFYRRKN